MGQNGGARPGSGRKSKAEEEKTKVIAIGAIIKKYGSAESGFEALLGTKEPSLIKFVFEHAYGRPPQEISLPEGIRITIGRDVK